LQKVKAILHSKMADAFSLLVSDTCIVGFVVVCIFKDEGARNVDWFKKNMDDSPPASIPPKTAPSYRIWSNV
jgi:hypothetical protein